MTTSRPAAPPADEFDAMPDYKEYVFNERWKDFRDPAYFDYRRQWEEVPTNKIETDFPLNVDIETTDVCNLACPMCSRTIKALAGALEDRLMSREEYADIIEQSASHGAKAVKLNYDGEPLAHKDIVWQVAHAKEKGILDVLINTNATLLRGAKAEPLLAAGVDTVIISFDAASPDLFAQQRVGTTIGKVIDNVYDFVNLRNKSYPKCRITMQMVMYDDEMWREQFEGIRIMWSRLVDAIGYSPLVDYENRDTGKYPKVDGWWCSQPFQRMVLKVNGNVTVCCPDIHDEMVVGSWRNERLYDIWHGPKFAEVRRKHAAGEYYDLDLCSRCSYAHIEKTV